MSGLKLNFFPSLFYATADMDSLVSTRPESKQCVTGQCHEPEDFRHRMARIFGGSNGDASTTKIVGTYGYIAPEYAMEDLYSVKSDVFSFGVLLFEIMTGKRNAGLHLSKCAPSLLAYAWRLWNEGKGLELMNPSLTHSCCDDFLRYPCNGLFCVEEDADWPTMTSVVVMLSSDVTLRQPKQPAFSVGRFTDRYEFNVDDSVNGLTVSDIFLR